MGLHEDIYIRGVIVKVNNKVCSMTVGYSYIKQFRHLNSPS